MRIALYLIPLFLSLVIIHVELRNCPVVDTVKLKCRKYPAVHANHVLYHGTTLQYNHNI